jgi:hypothetical protein
MKNKKSDRAFLSFLSFFIAFRRSIKKKGQRAIRFVRSTCLVCVLTCLFDQMPVSNANRFASLYKHVHSYTHGTHTHRRRTQQTKAPNKMNKRNQQKEQQTKSPNGTKRNQMESNGTKWNQQTKPANKKRQTKPANTQKTTKVF